MKKILFIFVIIICFIPKMVSAHGYGIPKEESNQRPYPGDNYHNIITNNDDIYIAEDTNKIYLTFDCGYENGYTKEMIDALYNNEVVGVFFVTGHYVKENADLVNYMLEKNQLVANHSYSHKDATTLTKEEIKADIERLEQLYLETTNQEFTPFFRPPAGTFTQESLQYVSELGYTNLFWSLAYKDWEREKSLGADYAISSIIPRLHNGAIILLHTVSKDNCLALNDIIVKIKELGYVIDNPMNLLTHNLT